MEAQSLYLLNLFLSSFMCGVIWLVQILIYPSFKLATDRKYHEFHIKTISIVVMPIMLMELGASIYLYFMAKSYITLFVLILLIMIWLSTFFLQVPQHRLVQEDSSPALIEKLISSNWIRSCLWTGKTLLLLWYGFT